MLDGGIQHPSASRYSSALLTTKYLGIMELNFSGGPGYGGFSPTMAEKNLQMHPPRGVVCLSQIT